MNETAIAFFSFWAAFFTAISLKQVFFKEQDTAVSVRLDKLARQLDRREDRIAVSHASSESPMIKDVRERLLHAGLKRKSDLQKFLLFRRVCYGAPIALSITLYFLLNVPAQTAVMVGILFGAIGVLIPRVWLIQVTMNRRKEIKRYLPDTIDLFVVAMEAGLSFDSALVRIGEEQRRVSTHISRELLFTNQEILVGKAKEEALRGLSKRCGITEMDSLVRAILQSNKLGTSLVKTFRVQSDTLRKKRKQEIRSKILKTPVKLLFPLLFFILPALMIIILTPSLVQIFKILNVKGGA